MMSAPVIASPVAVAEQLRGDRVTVGLVVDQNAAEDVAGLRVECFEQGAEVRSRCSRPPSRHVRLLPFCRRKATGNGPDI
jgi:hypothetical protein